ncbi:MAG TPA: HAMP domain-containing histidine kinase [Ghiorsea sp.]|nr:HAMP domain-containing histidine kinase [Ghiorsea sp.]HIP07524.1 HAMP domain-containing histidine kinase [Mariprofundaceae bacterium]
MKAKQDKVKDKMEKIQEMMRMFTHDLRNPLLNIQALVHELDLNVRATNSLSADTSETMDMLKESANRMDDMIVAANDIYHCMFDELEIEQVDMHELFLRCFASLKLAEEGIALSCSAMPLIQADPLMVQRIVLELLSNAKKAMVENTSNMPKTIRISTVEESEMVWFYVEDSGCGFIAHEMDRIFEPCFTGQKFSYGSGVGLARAKAMVEQHGGKMDVESVAGHALVGFSMPKNKKPTQ